MPGFSRKGGMRIESKQAYHAVRLSNSLGEGLQIRMRHDCLTSISMGMSCPFSLSRSRSIMMSTGSVTGAGYESVRLLTS